MSETPDSLGKYEQSGEIKPYSELGKESKKGWDSWGSAIITTPEGTQERTSYYSDPRIIRRLFTALLIDDLKQKEPNQHYDLVDFGGGDGIMLHLINYQLSMEPGVSRVTPTLIDLDEKKLESAKKQFPELEVVTGSLMQLPFEDNSIDMGVSRQVLQYFSGFENRWGVYLGLTNARDNTKSDLNQLNVLKEIHRVMKPGSIFNLVYTGTFIDSPYGRNISEFWNRVTAARTGQTIEEENQEREFVPGTFIKKVAEEIGFEVVSGEEIDWIEWRFTQQALFDRFDPKGTMSQERKDAIIRVFNEVEKPKDDQTMPFTATGDKIELDYIDFNGQKAIKIPLTRLLLRKIENSK